MVEFAPGHGATLPLDLERALARSGIIVDAGGGELRLAFPTPPSP